MALSAARSTGTYARGFRRRLPAGRVSSSSARISIAPGSSTAPRVASRNPGSRGSNERCVDAIDGLRVSGQLLERGNGLMFLSEGIDWPARASSTNSLRNSAGYGCLDLGIVNTSRSEDRGSTKPGATPCSRCQPQSRLLRLCLARLGRSFLLAVHDADTHRASAETSGLAFASSWSMLEPDDHMSFRFVDRHGGARRLMLFTHTRLTTSPARGGVRHGEARSD